MKKRQKERLKDITIDHIYDYCFNEIVRVLEGDHKLVTDVNIDIEKDPVSKLLKDIILESNKVKGYYDTRKNTYCKITHENGGINKSFAEKLKYQGFKAGKKLDDQINKTVEFLEFRSYISKNQPIATEFKLTKKGLFHYENGISFEDKFTSGRNARNAIIISIVSVVIAIIALVYPIFWR